MRELGRTWVQHPAVRLVVVGLIAAAAALVSMRSLPLGDYTMGPASVSPSASLGSGKTTVAVPPLGTVQVDSHTAPLSLGVQLTEIDFPSLARSVPTGEGREAVTATVEKGLRSMAVEVALRLLAGGLIVGLLAAAVLPYRRRSHLLAGAVGGVLAVAVAVGLTAATYDLDAFEEPRFTGTLQRAPQVLEAVNSRLDSFDDLQSRYETAAERITDLLALVADPIKNPSAGTVSVLHVSDIHSNPLGVEFVRTLARRFEVDVVLDTGDLTSFGQPVEAHIRRLVRRIPVAYLFVPGNHDSQLNRLQIDRAENVTLLDGDEVKVLGVDILGIGDPTFTATNQLSTEEANELKLEEAADVAEQVERERPDVLAVHDERTAEESFGLVPLILAGHTHKADMEQRDGTIKLVVGSSGATGLG
ncbi:MAG: metallophosphoesterase family protein, partial [Actinomycetota bacterium]